MKYGIYFAYWEDEWNVDQVKYVKKVKELGFDTLEISCAALKNISREKMDEYKNAAKEYGITLTGNFGPTAAENLSASDESEADHAVEVYRDILEKLAYMDIHTIGGGIYSYWPVDYSKPFDKRRDWEAAVKNVKKVARIAEDLGIDYCLEVLNRFEGYLLNTAAEALEFIKDVDVSSVKVLLDTFHMNIEEDSIVDAILMTGDKLGHVHVGENNRRVPGKGNLPWAEIGKALKRINYRKNVVMEPFVMDRGGVASDIKVWRPVCDYTEPGRLDRDAEGAVRFLRHVFE